MGERAPRPPRLRAGAGAAVAGAVQALEMQLHPHFLFNTLNAIADSSTRTRAGRAHDHAAQRPPAPRAPRQREQEVTLEEELAFLRSYLEIQQTLLQDRLVVTGR